MVLARHSAFTPQDFQKMMGLTVGFDTFFDRFFDMDSTRDSGYPPYNIRKLNEVQYVIEVALAGFSKDDIEVEVTDGFPDVMKAENTVTSIAFNDPRTDDYFCYVLDPTDKLGLGEKTVIISKNSCHGHFNSGEEC